MAHMSKAGVSPAPLANRTAIPNSATMTLTDRIADKRQDLVALTQDLIRIPTLNPPGENFRI